METQTLNDSASQPQEVPVPKRRLPNPAKVAHTLDKLGLGFFSPFVLLIAKDEPAKQVRQILLSIILPLLAIGAFMAFWQFTADEVQTDSMKIPSPAETWSAWEGIVDFANREADKEKVFNERMIASVDKWEVKVAEATTPEQKQRAQEMVDRFAGRTYVGPPTFFDQIWTSLFTVAVGFFVATLIAVPMGILCGLSKYFNMAVNPLIQVFKPVSPLAWLPIVFVFVTALYTPAEDEQTFTRAMLISALTVTLCSLWPTLINTAVGVAGIDPDHMNVARVLRLNWWQRLWKIVLPSALPLMFTGMRLSLGVGWMVLIAADMLAQNPGLGKFVWDTFQNGSTKSMAEIVCAVFVVGFIGFALDRIMLVCQRFVSFDDQAI